MALRIPFFGLISTRSPLPGLLEHYEQIAKGMELIEESMECYISGDSDSTCKEFNMLLAEVNEVEEHADTIKRYIRNHLPRGIFFPVDKHLFFSYTRAQDDILDAGQDSLQWLSMREMIVPEIFQRDLIFYLDDVAKTIRKLRPALEGTIAWVNGEGMDREGLKPLFRDIRNQHKIVTQKKQTIISAIYRSKLDFKDIYQLINFVEKLHTMSHSAEGCADMLRVMIAR